MISSNYQKSNWSVNPILMIFEEIFLGGGVASVVASTWRQCGAIKIVLKFQQW